MYVFNNILRTRHYGAQTTRTGRVRNELIGVVFADGEITSNLRWTQAIYDAMKAQDTLRLTDPLNEDDVMMAAKSAIEKLMAEEFIVYRSLIGDTFKPLLDEVKTITGHEVTIKAMLQKAMDESNAYFAAYVEKPKKSTAKAG